MIARTVPFPLQLTLADVRDHSLESFPALAEKHFQCPKLVFHIANFCLDELRRRAHLDHGQPLEVQVIAIDFSNWGDDDIADGLTDVSRLFNLAGNVPDDDGTIRHWCTRLATAILLRAGTRITGGRRN